MPSIGFDIFAKDRASAVFDHVGRKTDDLGGKTKSWGSVSKLATAGVGLAIAKFASDSVRAFKESEDAQKALGFAFQKFPALSDTNQKALQKLNSELQKKTRFDDDNIASGQAVLAQFKLTGTQIKQVTPLLLDYASKTGKDIPAAAQDVGKALLGNAKALKNIGINFKGTGNAAKDFASVTALMREKVGGFAELEGKTASGRAAILKNQFGELQETIGSKLVPGMTRLVNIGLKTVDWISRNQKLVAALGTGFLVLASAVKAVEVTQRVWSAGAAFAATVQKGLAKATTNATVAIEGQAAAQTQASRSSFGMKAGAVGAASAIAAVGGALAYAGFALTKYMDRNNSFLKATADMKASMKGVSDAFRADGLAVGSATREYVAGQLQQTGLAAKAEKAGISLNQLTSGVIGNKEEFARLVETWRAGGKPSGDTIAALLMMRAQFVGGSTDAGKLDKAVSGTTSTTNYMTAATKELTEKEAEARKKAIEYRDSVDSLRDSLDKLNGKNISAVESQIKLKEGLDQLRTRFDEAKKSHEKYSTSLDINTKAGRENYSAVLDNIKAATDHALAIKNQTGSGLAAAKAMLIDEAAIRRAAAAAGFNKGQVDLMIRQYGKVPKDVRTTVDFRADQAHSKAIALQKRISKLGVPITAKVLADTSQATLAIARTAQQLRALNGATATTYVNTVMSVNKRNALQGRASGGSATKNVPIIVGEHRAEMFVPNQNGRIVPRVPVMSGGGGGDTFNITISGAMDANAVAQQMQQLLLRLKRSNGGHGLGFE